MTRRATDHPEPAHPKAVAYLADLSPEQRAAADHEGGPMLVVAGPGTGKTRVLIARIARRILSGTDPESIVALTFTNKAAGEMRDRLGVVFPDGAASGVVVGTFHAVGWRLVRRFADRLGLPARPSIMDSAQRRALATTLALDHGLLGTAAGAGVRTAVDVVLRTIERLEHAAVSPERAREAAQRLREIKPGAAESLERAAALMPLFRAASLERGLVTLDDLIRLPCELLARDAGAAALVRSGWRCVLADEIQDVNVAQVRMLEALAPPRTGAGPDVLGVGDDDQAIYAFRGADERALHRFERIWPGCARVRLTENHRSLPEIVHACNRVIARAHARFDPDKALVPRRAVPAGSDGPVVSAITHANNAPFEPALAAQIRRAHAGAQARGASWRDIAVIAPSHVVLDRVNDALEIEGIPARRVRGTPPAEDEGVQDLMAWARLVVDPDDEVSAMRILSRPPFSVPHATRSRAARAFRRSRLGPAGASDRTGGMLTFSAAWLDAERDPAAPIAAAAAARFDDAVRTIGTARADRAIAYLIRASEAAHAEPLSPRARARRVTALAAVLRFVRSHAERLDPPGDLASFLRYHADLDEDQQKFTARELDPDDPRADEAEQSDSADPTPDRTTDPTASQSGDQPPDAVTLVTAHSSKGLEFDTVFVVRAEPLGFGRKQAADEDVPEPTDLDDLAPDSRTPEQRGRDERRRLFYVACTRAEHRLIVVGATRATSTKSSPQHFLMELLDDGVPRRSVDDVLALPDAAERLEREVTAAVRAKEGDTDVHRRIARAALAEALSLAEHAPGAAAFDTAARSVREQLARLAVLARGADLAVALGVEPDWAARIGPLIARPDPAGSSVAAPAPRPGAKGRSKSPPPPDDSNANLPAFPPHRAPLRLSYSMLTAYHACPMCYYITQRLGLDDPPGPALAFGNAVHGALNAFYRAWADADADGTPRPGVEDLVRRARAAVYNDAALPPDRARLEQAEAQMRLAWQHLHDDAAQIEELEHTVRVPYPRGPHRHTLVARIDRIDRLGSLTRVVDYKTGNANKELLEPKATDLQAGVYLLALQHLRQDQEIDGVFEYWLLSTGQRGRLAFADIDLDHTRALIDAAIDGLLNGRFARGAACTGANSPCRSFDPLTLGPEDPDDPVGFRRPDPGISDHPAPPDGTDW